MNIYIDIRIKMQINTHNTMNGATDMNMNMHSNRNTNIINNLNAINRLLIKSSNKYILITGSLYLIGKIRKKYL